MRKSLAICLILGATMLVGCRTQSWRGADNPWSVHSGLYEVSLGGAGGFLAARDESFGSDTEEFDFETTTFHAQAAFGYLINDFWEVGAFVEGTRETWDPDDFDEVDVLGWAFGPRVTVNLSNVDPDVVPYLALSGGYGMVTYDVPSVGDFDADRLFAQLGMGVRVFVWDQVAINVEGYYRHVTDHVDDTVDGFSVDTNIDGNEGGVLLSVSYFF